MSHATPSEAEVASTLSQLKISTKSPSKPIARPKSKPVADSWDDELGSGSDTETETETNTSTVSRTSTKESSLSPISTLNSAELPNPPPPTPASPQAFDYPDNTPYGLTRSREGSGNTTPARRPDKTTAVAGRLIAAGLGVRAPKRTDEEREYDKAMREQQRKKRDEERQREKAEQEAAEKRKQAIWDD